MSSPVSKSSLQSNGPPPSSLSSTAATMAQPRLDPAHKPRSSSPGMAPPSSRLQPPDYGSNPMQMPAGQPSQSIASSGAGVLMSPAQMPARQPSQSIASSGASQLARSSLGAARPPPPGFAKSGNHLHQHAASSPAAASRNAGQSLDTGYQAAYRALVGNGSASIAASADAQPLASRYDAAEAAHHAAQQRLTAAHSARGATGTAVHRPPAAVPYYTQAQQVTHAYIPCLMKVPPLDVKKCCMESHTPLCDRLHAGQPSTVRGAQTGPQDWAAAGRCGLVGHPQRQPPCKWRAPATSSTWWSRNV